MFIFRNKSVPLMSKNVHLVQNFCANFKIASSCAIKTQLYATYPAAKRKKPVKPCPKIEMDPCFTKDNLSAILYGRNNIKLEQQPIPSIRDNEILISLECVGLSALDLKLIQEGRHNDEIIGEPLVLGHEASGTVAKVGKKVKQFQPGDRIAIEPCMPCRKCSFCSQGRYNLCPKILFCSVPPLNGMLSRYFAWPAEFCYKIPHTMSFEEAALLEPLSVANYACKRGRVTAGSKVAIFGAGPIGLLSMLCAKACGATKTVIIDKNQRRLQRANTLGVDNIVCIEEEEDDCDIGDKIIEALGSDPDICLECSGAKQAIKIAANITVSGGVTVLVGTGRSQVKIAMEDMLREVDIRGVFNYCNNFKSCLDLMANNRVDLKHIVTHHFKLEEICDAVELAAQGEAIKIMIHTNPKWIADKKRSIF